MYENFDHSENSINGTLKLFSEADIKTVFMTLETSLTGIKNEEATSRLEKFGLNEISKEKVKPWYIQLLLAFLNPFNFILGTLAFVSLFTDVIFAKETERSWISIILIVTMVLISSFIKFIQEYRSSKTAEKLKNLIVTKVTVIRDNLPMEINIKSLVPGDIVKLTAGDIVPGDIRIVSSKDLFISQSVLTGESNPIEKYSNLLAKTGAISDLSNIVLMGTNVLSGAATGIVLGTGKHTFLNTISESLKNTKVETSFEKGIDDVSKLLIKFMFFMVPIVFLINGYLK
ncbi:MAG: HAD-IC family P-type ATPase, partial [Cetobacterium sp.]|uniref:HAD-IC family P-type ATPase n=1 Tax=Cetobacterium sp. TaxID=2071632 RepID=UPI003F377D57